jgi:hypothetical protein
MENLTFNYKDDKFSIRPQAPPGGETHFNISDSGYGDKEIYRKHKRNNHPSNDINPPPNFVKKEDEIENTPNGAAPVTGNRPSIKLSAPPGGFSVFDNYDESKPFETEVQSGPISDKPIQNEPQALSEKEPVDGGKIQNRKNSNSKSSSFFGSDDNSPYKPYYAPQAPPGGKSSISFGYDEPVEKPKPKPKPKPDQNQEVEVGSKKTFRPVYTPQAPPGGKSSISFGYDEPINKPIKPKQNQETELSNKKTFRPVYTPQAPPGGKSSISFGNEEPIDRPKPRPNPEFKESFFNNNEQKPTVKHNSNTKQNNQNNFNSSFFNSNNDDNTTYKPYYAPQAPPGGKDSISFNNNEENKDNTPTTTTSFAGRRRNYNSDHFKSSISFNY